MNVEDISVRHVLYLATQHAELDDALRYLKESIDDAVKMYEVIVAIRDAIDGFRIVRKCFDTDTVESIRSVETIYEDWAYGTANEIFHAKVNDAIAYVGEIDDDPENETLLGDLLADRIDVLADEIRRDDCGAMRLALRTAHREFGRVTPLLQRDAEAAERCWKAVCGALA